MGMKKKEKEKGEGDEKLLKDRGRTERKERQEEKEDEMKEKKIVEYRKGNNTTE